MKNTILKEAYELLRKAEMVSTESEFSLDWLGHSESYLRRLRFKNAEPSLGSVAICAVRLQKTGEQMLTSRYKQLGIQVIAMSEKLHQQVTEQGVEFELAD